jgi:hypothetical protein
MLDRNRLARAVIRLRSERPSDWRDELDLLETERVRGRSVRLKHASITELSALVVLLEERPTGDRATFHDRVWRRIALRRRLRLANDSCYGKPVNAACRCGEEGLDALTDGELQPLTLMEARARVLELAKERHQRAPRPRKVKPKAAAPFPSESELESLLHAPSEAAPPEAAPTPKLEPRRRHQRREPAHPTSWAAFKRHRDGPQTAAEICDYQF